MSLEQDMKFDNFYKMICFCSLDGQHETDFFVVCKNDENTEQ